MGPSLTLGFSPAREAKLPATWDYPGRSLNLPGLSSTIEGMASAKADPAIQQFSKMGQSTSTTSAIPR
jgi:hypothetical protein